MNPIYLVISFAIALIAVAIVIWDIHSQSDKKKIAILITAFCSFAACMAYVVEAIMAV